jgi:hypothetical protein
MLHLETNRGVRFCDGLTRRDFLRAGSLAVGLTLTELAHLGRAAPTGEKACIQLCLVGGPGQLDTWDLKPGAPEEVRGPFRPIRTNVPGLDVCEHFPLLSMRADRFALVRSVHHREAPIHETGHQLLQTGRLSRAGGEWPHAGAAAARLKPSPAGVPSWALLPGPIGNTGVDIDHGQGPGPLGPAFAPVVLRDPRSPFGLDPAQPSSPGALADAVADAERALEPDGPLAAVLGPRGRRAFDLRAEPERVRDRYGRDTFGQSCLLARRLVEHGVRLVTVNMFDTVFNRVTWDCHANGGDLSTNLNDYHETLCPMFDRACSALLEDLAGRGLLDSTLVVAAGEFGRTPKVNARFGRDHWPGVWSVLLAGGGVRGGQVVGSSDRHAAEPRDRPVHAAEIAATVYHALGIDPRTPLPGPDGRAAPLVEADPVRELF